MNSLFMTELKSIGAVKVHTSRVDPGKKFLLQTKLWKEDLQFSLKEIDFYSWLILQALVLAPEPSKSMLMILRHEIDNLKSLKIKKFVKDLSRFEMMIQVDTNSKYPSNSFNKFYAEFMCMERLMQEMTEDLRTYKVRTFDLLNEFLTVSIY